ncbi:MAG: hypothetical protein GY866_05860 [Proteobacteria bacterium]|nr:hypothetical protein [Pseudomonadota bacterium]
MKRFGKTTTTLLFLLLAFLLILGCKQLGLEEDDDDDGDDVAPYNLTQSAFLTDAEMEQYAGDALQRAGWSEGELTPVTDDNMLEVSASASEAYGIVMDSLGGNLPAASPIYPNTFETVQKSLKQWVSKKVFKNKALNAETNPTTTTFDNQVENCVGGGTATLNGFVQTKESMVSDFQGSASTSARMDIVFNNCSLDGETGSMLIFGTGKYELSTATTMEATMITVNGYQYPETGTARVEMDEGFYSGLAFQDQTGKKYEIRFYWLTDSDSELNYDFSTVYQTGDENDMVESTTMTLEVETGINDYTCSASATFDPVDTTADIPEPTCS